MELIFQAELENATRRLFAEVAPDLDIPRVRVEEPKDPAFGFFSSGVAFQIAKTLHLAPEEIAVKLIAAMSQDRFHLSVDGGGYVNVTPTLSGRREFFIAEQSLSLPLLPVDWEAKYLKRAFQNSDEARLLRSSFPHLSRATSLQILASLGDGEISSTPFLNGFGSSENVPWYLERYEAVTREIGGAAGEVSSPLLRPLADLTIRFRGRVWREFEERRPERALTTVLSGVRAFFAVYNRPEVREALRIDSLLGRELRVVNNPLSRFVGEVLRRIEFPGGEAERNS